MEEQFLKDDVQTKQNADFDMMNNIPIKLQPGIAEEELLKADQGVFLEKEYMQASPQQENCTDPSGADIQIEVDQDGGIADQVPPSEIQKMLDIELDNELLRPSISKTESRDVTERYTFRPDSIESRFSKQLWPKDAAIIEEE